MTAMTHSSCNCIFNTCPRDEPWHDFCLIWFFTWFDSLHLINNLSVTKGHVFLGWTSTKLRSMCLAQGHNAVMWVRLEPAAPRSWVKHSTTEPLRFLTVTWEKQQCGSASWEDSDQSDPSLHCLHEEILGLYYPLSSQQNLWSDWADAQADLGLCSENTHFFGFVMSRLRK